MIRIDNLNFSYGQRKIISNINLTIQTGSFVAILGANGVGKTTLFRCLLGLENHYTGHIYVDDQDIKNMTCKKRANYLAYIPQSHTLTYDYTVLDMIIMGTVNHLNWYQTPHKTGYKKALNALERLNLMAYQDRIFNQLSGGEKQMVLVARALAQEAPVLVLDEPTANLDYGNQILLLNQINWLKELGYTIVMSTHNPQHAMQYADTVVAMSDQEIIALGHPKEIINTSLLKQLYKTDIDIHWINEEAMFLPKKEVDSNDVFVEEKNG